MSVKFKGKRKKIYSDPLGKKLFVREFDAEGKPKDSRLLCLDDQGNMRKDNMGRPILVDFFRYIWRARVTKEWGNWYVKKKTYEFFCLNCAEMTDGQCSDIYW